MTGVLQHGIVAVPVDTTTQQRTLIAQLTLTALPESPVVRADIRPGRHPAVRRKLRANASSTVAESGTHG